MGAVDVRGEVLEVRRLPLPHFLLRIRVEGMPQAAAGQFVMVAGDRQEPYLRRAFSVYQQEEAGGGALVISLLGKVVGRGTAVLAASVPGERVPVLGPLGTGFQTVESRVAVAEAPDLRPVALVAGGIGSAGLGLLSQSMASARRRFDFFYGGRTAEDLVEAAAFRLWSEESGGGLVRTTEDGSEGGQGLITTALEAALRASGEGETPSYRALYTCGPHGLMAAVARIATAHGLEGQAAVETPMGCGYGACLGCAVPLVRGGYGLCCQHGPVFGLAEVVW